jgi:hypothetical protein
LLAIALPIAVPMIVLVALKVPVAQLLLSLVKAI